MLLTGINWTMFALATRAGIMRAIFGIPKGYILSKKEGTKLFRYSIEAEKVHEALMCRILDCSAFCDEEKCYFCSTQSQ